MRLPAVRLTRRGVAVLISAIALYAAGELAGWPMLRAVAGAALGALIAGVVTTVRRPRVEVRREVYPDRVESGRPALATLRVTNPTRRRQSAFLARDRIEHGGEHSVLVPSLPPGGTATFHYELPTERRGRITVGPLQMARVDPLGVVRRPLATGNTATLRVYPKTYPARERVGGYPRHHHEGRAIDEPLHGSSDLRDVREYVIGDEVRHLHWKATAHTGRLMVRDYIDPDQPRFSVLLDTRKRVLRPDEFEQAVQVAASLVKPAALAGHRCRLLTPGGIDVATPGGPAALRRILDALCDVAQSDEPEGDVIVPKTLAGSGAGGGGLLVAVTGRVDQRDVRGLSTVRDRYSRMVLIGVAKHGLGWDGIGVQRLSGLPAAQAISAVDAEQAIREWNAVVV
jgi:uncharacterized protein (DUF58 family)